MHSDKKLLDAYREQHNTGNLFNEAQVLDLMQFAREQERNRTAEDSMVATFLERVCEIYKKPFNGHPSREDDSKNQEAIVFMAVQIDNLHKLLIQKK